MRPVSAPPPDGRTRNWKWPLRLAEAQAQPHQWFEIVGVPKSTAQYFRENHVNRQRDFYCVTRNWRDGNRICDVYIIYSPGKDPHA